MVAYHFPECRQKNVISLRRCTMQRRKNGDVLEM